MAFTPATTLEAVEALYIGYFGRAGEPGGVQYWVNQINNGQTFAQAAAAFSVQAEAKAQHPFLANPSLVSPADFVESLYQQLFGRASDAEGKAYWVAQLSAANGNPFAYGLIVAQFISGAQNSAAGNDIDVLQNKIDAAEYFTTKLAGAGIQGVDADGQVLPDVDTAATNTIAGVTDDEATVDASKAATDAFVSGGGGNEGETFTLTTGADNFTGTAKNDTFQAIVGPAGDQTITNFDKAVGGGGVDTMNIISLDGSAALPASASISGIELINFDFAVNSTATIDASKFVGSTTITLAGFGSAVSGLTGQTVVADGVTLEATDVLTSDSAIKVQLNDVASGSYVATAGKHTSIDVTGSVDGGGTLLLDSTGTKLATVSLALTSDTTVDVSGIIDITKFTTFDASKSTGDLTVDFDVATTGDYLTTIKLGSGNDTVTFDQFEANNEDGGIEQTIDLGAGNDTITVGVQSTTANTRVDITLGAGNDLANLESYGNVVTLADAEDVEAALVSIADFNVDEDTIDVSTSWGTFDTLTNVELAAVADADDLLAAFTLAATSIATSGSTAFEFDGNVYVFNDENGSGTFNAGDTAVEIVGVTLSQLNAANFLTA